MRSASATLRLVRKRPFLAALLSIAALCALNVARFAVWPPVGHLARDNPATTAFIEYRKAQWRDQGLDKTVRRVWKPLSVISPHLGKAVVTAEDSAFWDHGGFDLTGMRDALIRNIRRGRFAAGGSTITQQLAKNLFLSPDRSVTRKLQEALVAKRLEWSLSKERILELYLNCVEWGDGIFGAEAAARHYFGVGAADLSVYQAATLAAMLPAPLKRAPGSPAVRKAANTIAARMRIE